MKVENAYNLASALVNFTDSLPEKPAVVFDLSHRIAGFFDSLVESLAERQEDEGIRLSGVASKIFENSSGVTLQARFCADLYGRRENSQHKRERVTDAEMKDLLEIAVEKISKFAKMHKLQYLSQGLYLLYRWQNWDQSGRVAAWVKLVVRSPEGLTWFLRGMLDSSRQPDSGLLGNPFVVNINNARLFIDSEALQEIIASEGATNLPSAEKQLRQAFTKAVKREISRPASSDLSSSE